MIENISFSTSKRRIGIFVMVLAMLLQTIIPVAAQNAEEDIELLNSIALLEKIGIVTEDDGMQYTEENITRENFASMLGVFYGISRSDINTYNGAGIFSDVDKKSPMAHTIETVAGAGAMDAYKDGKFRPTANLTMEQAAKAMVVLLGYGKIFSNVTTDSNTYVKQARDLDLLKGITTGAKDSITKGEVVKMFARAIDAEILKQAVYGNELEYITVKGETLASEKLDIHKIEGILTATDITGIAKNEASPKGCIVVDGYEIKTTQDMNMYLGMELDVYCYGEDQDELSLVHYQGRRKRNDEETVLAEDIQSVNSSSITYYAGNRTKKARLASDVTVIFNGKNNPLYTDDTFKIKNGSIRFLDADTDGKYEVVFVKSYINVWVSQVYMDSDNILSLVGNGTQGKVYSIDTDKTNTNVVFKKNDAPATYSDITKKSVISIAADKMNYQTKDIMPGATYIEIEISTNFYEGALEGVDYDEHEAEVDGAIYKIEEGLNFQAEGVNLGDTAKFYLDAFGRIVALEKGASNTYGIIDRVYKDSFTEDVSEIKIFTQDGAFKKFEVAPKFSIDGERFKADEANEITDALVAGSNKFFIETGMSRTGARPEFQLVKYSTNNDGQIIAIDTMVQNSTNAEVEKNYLHFSKKFERYTKFFDKTNATTIAGQYLYDKNLVVFKLPNDKSKTEAFAKKTSITAIAGYENTLIPLFAFDDDEYNYVPLIIGESEAKEKVADKEDKNMMVFEKQKIKMKEDGELYVTLIGTSIKAGTEAVAYIPQDDFATKFGSIQIEPGDVIRWSTDDLDNVKSLELTMENVGPTSVITSVDSNGNKVTKHDTGYYTDFRITCGTVERMNDKYILFNNGTAQSANIINSGAKVLVYNSDTKRTEPGSWAQIKTRESFPNNPSLVFTYQWFSELRAIVIFN